MNARRLERVLAQMVRDVPASMSALGVRRDSCILHTRVAVDVLARLGVSARPLAVKVTVANSEWVRLGKRLNRPPERDEWTDDTWVLGMGFGLDPRQTRPGYDGHVIAIVNERFALDLTLDQASRPERSMVVGPHYWPAHPMFLRGERPDVHVSTDGSVAIYQANPDERSFTQYPDWNLKITGSVVPDLAATLRAIP